MGEAMLSQSAPIFYGDIGSHERVPIPFSTFLGFCKKHIQNKDGDLDDYFGPQRHDQAGSNIEQGSLHLEDVPEQIYLAQVENSRSMRRSGRILRRLIDKEMQNFPRTLEVLVLHVLSPVGAEVLTRKFDEMDQQTLAEDRNRFYEAFYSAFDDQSMAMNSMLKGKESFAQQAFKNMLEKLV